jgi:serine/threonine-protein kinase
VLLSSRFELLDVAARGGIATVNRAVDRITGKLVAIKRLERLACSARVRDRFAGEAAVLRAIRVPGIPRYVAHDCLGEVPFIAMELLPGRRLTDLRTGARPWTLGEIGRVVAGVLAILARLHHQGWVHGDLSSRNILVAGGHGRQRAALVDLGLARRIGDVQPVDEICGTPRYMAPELFDAAPPSVASDVYGAGVILAELLVAGPPCGHATTAPLTILAAGATRLGAVVETAVRERPGERFDSALAMRRALRGALASSDRRLLVTPPAAESGPEAAPPA